MNSLPDIAGTSAAVSLGTLLSGNVMARSVSFGVVSGGGQVRVGGSGVGTGQGYPFTTTYTIDYQGEQVGISLASIYVYVPTGTTIGIAYVPFN